MGTLSKGCILLPGSSDLVSRVIRTLELSVLTFFISLVTLSIDPPSRNHAT